ncbi:preprotein translocase subunit YajC [Haloechinothrix salitolerans]|uniref:Preprotein translocase subunit YajC n=1 Tax=Haloechinothrix salitolerans TaxID=926830 RepID=A0ABW2C5K2_9PSEU
MELLIVMMAGLGLMMFFAVRKQKKEMAAHHELQDSLTEGDRVRTTSGLEATVVDASDDTTIDLEIADGVVTTWLRPAVREKVEAADEFDEDVDETDEDRDDADTTDSDEDGDERSDAQVAPPLEHKGK